MIQKTNTTSTINVIARWFVGLVFLFSSFTKGVDPLGTAFKIEEYMTAWSFGDISFAAFLPLAPVLSMVLVTLEFLVGIMLITGSFRKLSAWMLTLMMVFFTCTTLYDAITNKVSDCGCFGDFLKLTNWQTFWKNVVLDVPTAYIFLTKRWPRGKQLERDTLIAIAATAAMTIFGIYNINNEPLLDFRPWKVGNTMIDNIEEGLPTINKMRYHNKETGKQKWFETDELMKSYAEDSTFADLWEWDSTITISPYEVHADGFFIMDADNQDMTFDLIAATDSPVMICTIHHIDDIDERGIQAIALVKQLAIEKNLRFAVLAYVNTDGPEDDEMTTSEGKLQKFLYMNNLMDVEYYFGDEKAIETMLRSNPGFIMMHNAEVKGKWHYRNAHKIREYNF